MLNEISELRSEVARLTSSLQGSCLGTQFIAQPSQPSSRPPDLLLAPSVAADTTRTDSDRKFVLNFGLNQPGMNTDRVGASSKLSSHASSEFAFNQAQHQVKDGHINNLNKMHLESLDTDAANDSAAVDTSLHKQRSLSKEKERAQSSRERQETDAKGMLKSFLTEAKKNETKEVKEIEELYKVQKELQEKLQRTNQLLGSKSSYSREKQPLNDLQELSHQSTARYERLRQQAE